MKPYYRLGDTPSQDECDALGVLRKDNLATSWAPPKRDGVFLAAKYTREHREPRKGEWYLSGADPIAFKAPNDLSTKFRIMKLVAVQRQTKIILTELGQ